MPCLMGSSIALNALRRGEVHVAGIHLAEEGTDGWKLPNLKESLGDMDFIVVTFAYWEEGSIVFRAIPKRSGPSSILPTTVKIVNREFGSGARRLLDKQLLASGIKPNAVRGYEEEALSHLDLASRIKAGFVDTGIGVRAAASIAGLDFVPLQRERYDLIIPKQYYESLSGLQVLLDTMVSKTFRDEVEALGGYDTRDMGRLVETPT